MSKMEIEKSERGFEFSEFEDSYGLKCSIKKSSAAMDDYIWLGVSKPGLTVFKDDSLGQYLQTELPKNWRVDSLMHLSRKDVKKLLPMLQNFVETGELS